MLPTSQSIIILHFIDDILFEYIIKSIRGANIIINETKLRCQHYYQCDKTGPTPTPCSVSYRGIDDLQLQHFANNKGRLRILTPSNFYRPNSFISPPKFSNFHIVSTTFPRKFFRMHPSNRSNTRILVTFFYFETSGKFDSRCPLHVPSRL